MPKRQVIFMRHIGKKIKTYLIAKGQIGIKCDCCNSSKEIIEATQRKKKDDPSEVKSDDAHQDFFP